MFAFDTTKLQYEIDNGYVSRRQHPTNPNLFILNYTHKCSFDWRWNKTTIHCRGTIVDSNNNVLWKPFPKFFTFDQYKELRNSVYELYGLKYKDCFSGPYRTEEKIDGSLGILYHNGVEWAIASRGSFDSEQALKGTEIWRKKYSGVTPDPSLTYVLEIVYPENRIIVDYGSISDLFLLDVLETHTGKSVINRNTFIPDYYNLYNKPPKPQPGPIQASSLDTFIFSDADKEEGFVIKYDNGIYVKVKSPEYLKVAKILSNVTDRYIIDLLANHESQKIMDILGELPRIDYERFVEKIDKYETQHNLILDEIKEIVDWNIWLSDRDFGLKFGKHKLQGPIFSYRNRKDYNKAIWEYIRRNYKNENKNIESLCKD